MNGVARRRSRRNDPPRIQIRYVSIDDIVPYEFNPRDNAEAVASVANSIQEFGFLVPVVLDGNNVLVAGHTRVEGAKTLGMDEVPAVFAQHLSPEAIRQFRIIDNKVAEQATWNLDLLAQEIHALSGSGIDFTNFGFAQEEIDCLGQTVADDCLSGEVSRDLTAQENTPSRVVGRGPETVRFVLGEFIFRIPTDVYRLWTNSVKTDGDFEEGAIIELLKDRLGILAIEEGRRSRRTRRT